VADIEGSFRRMARTADGTAAPAASGLAAIRAVDEIRRRLERNLPDAQVYDEALRAMVRGEGVLS